MQGAAEIGRFVAGRDGRCDGAGDQVVSFEGAQGLGEQLLADADQPARQFRIVQRTGRTGARVGRLRRPVAAQRGHDLVRPTCPRFVPAVYGSGRQQKGVVFGLGLCALLGCCRRCHRPSANPRGALRTSKCLLPPPGVRLPGPRNRCLVREFTPKLLPYLFRGTAGPRKRACRMVAFRTPVITVH